MNTIPQIPTDNLYKFLAIFGLVLIIVSVVITHQKTEDYLDRLSDHTKGLRNFIDEDYKHYGDSSLKYQEYRSLLEAADGNEKTRLAVEDLFLNDIKLKLRWLQITGILLCVVGFGLWWWKVQRFQDIILKTEAQNEKERTGQEGMF